MASLVILFILGGSWFLLVTFLVLGMCRQKYMRRASSSSSSTFSSGNGRSSSSSALGAAARARDLTATSSVASTDAAGAAGKVGTPKKA
ncbi:predicted protein [Histoplasma mississippiense (nom. inval.)]|uniref:predicted protein n=1 Tax=Ajellomyces capsulatus (strain NAm1 / WU24) TaxID=2059318 RepID=UPI000157BB04|nr:predicted protein [Histoplasma mississippiense (nom. inval.)]EDN05803.1 predicted protein [Histoplasma mississippiense (nom. inval.)]